MTAMPTKSHLTSSAATEAQFQAAIGAVYDVLNELPNIGPAQSIEIASGAVTPSKGMLTLDTENLAAADNLDFILATNLGERMVILGSTSASRVITIRHNQSGTGKIITLDAQPIILSDPNYKVILFYVTASASWVEISRNFGIYATSSDLAAIRAKLGLGTASTKDTGTSSGQVPLNSNLGSAAYLNSGSGAGQVPTNGILGDVAYLDTVPSSYLDSSGVTPGTYNQFTVNAKGLVTSATMVAAGVGTNSVGQSQLKTSIFVASLNVFGGGAWDSVGPTQPFLNSTSVTSGMTRRFYRTTRFGGEFTFTPTIAFDAVSSNGFNYIESMELLNFESVPARDNSLYVAVRVPTSVSGITQNINVGARFVTASAPYNLGDGDVYGFVYALLDKDGKPQAVVLSDTPPWAYNGPTRISPDYICPSTGKKYQFKKEKLSFEQRMAGVEPLVEIVEIGHEIKNADMALFPHPFSGKTDDQTVVLLNPMDPDVAKLIMLAEEGENVNKLILDGKFKIGNTMDNVTTPDGVLPVSFRW